MGNINEKFGYKYVPRENVDAAGTLNFKIILASDVSRRTVHLISLRFPKAFAFVTVFEYHTAKTDLLRKVKYCMNLDANSSRKMQKSMHFLYIFA